MAHSRVFSEKKNYNPGNQGRIQDFCQGGGSTSFRKIVQGGGSASKNFSSRGGAKEIFSSGFIRLIFKNFLPGRLNFDFFARFSALKY